MTELEIVNNIKPQLPIGKLVKIPGSSHLLKIMYVTSKSADMAIIQGINILFQRFTGNSIEKEVFVPVVPCYRCYSYEHQKRSCTKPQSFKICSNCASEGHVYTECTSSIYKCINCLGEHHTLVAKCPKRKELIKKKIKEKKIPI